MPVSALTTRHKRGASKPNDAVLICAQSHSFDLKDLKLLLVVVFAGPPPTMRAGGIQIGGSSNFACDDFTIIG